MPFKKWRLLNFQTPSVLEKRRRNEENVFKKPTPASPQNKNISNLTYIIYYIHYYKRLTYALLLVFLLPFYACMIYHIIIKVLHDEYIIGFPFFIAWKIYIFSW